MNWNLEATISIRTKSLAFKSVTMNSSGKLLFHAEICQRKDEAFPLVEALNYAFFLPSGSTFSVASSSKLIFLLSTITL